MHLFQFVALLLTALCVLAEPIRIQIINDSKDADVPLEFALQDGALRDRPVGRRGSLLDVIKDEKMFSRFYDMIEKHKGLKDEIDQSDKMTIFAPTNDAIERWEKKHGGKALAGDDWKTEEIVHYHMIPDEELTHKTFNDGMLLNTRLKLKKLQDAHQRVRVTKFGGHVFLNMYARVCFEKQHRSERGVVLALEDVMIPPRDLSDILCTLPSKFSTTVAALNIVGMEKELLDAKAMTLMAPDNAAWKALGFMNLYHLFSVKGRDDLKKILQYHMGKDVTYTTKMMREEKVKIKTHLKDEELHIEACRRDNQKRAWGDAFSSENHKPADYMFIVNKGEARIKFTDGLAENGVIQVVNEVLVPPGVKLPYTSCEENPSLLSFNAPELSFMDTE